MHPFMAVYIWSMSMSRAWQQALVGAPGDAFDATDHATLRPSYPALAIKAGEYIQSNVVNLPLPDFILDKLADLHWEERDPHLAI